MEHLKASHKSELVSASDRFVDEKSELERNMNGGFFQLGPGLVDQKGFDIGRALQ